jgi:hypothetical protein
MASMRSVPVTSGGIGAVLVVACLVSSCSRAGHASSDQATTTSVAATSSTTASTDSPVEEVKGDDDQAVQRRISNVITAEKTIFMDESAYTDDLSRLTELDDTFHLTAGVAAPSSPTQVAVAVSADRQWVCATGRSAAGHTWVLVTGPAYAVYVGSASLSKCDQAATTGMRVANQ